MTSSTSSLDTCAIIHFLIRDIPAQTDRVVALLADENQLFAVDDAAIIEAVHVFETCYFRTRPQIAEKLDTLFSLANIKFSPVFSDILPLYLSHPKLSFTDIYLAQKSERSHSEPLWTFDQKLSTQLPQSKLIP